MGCPIFALCLLISSFLDSIGVGCSFSYVVFDLLVIFETFSGIGSFGLLLDGRWLVAGLVTLSFGVLGSVDIDDVREAGWREPGCLVGQAAFFLVPGSTRFVSPSLSLLKTTGV